MVDKIKSLSEHASAISADIQAAVGQLGAEKTSSTVDNDDIYFRHAEKLDLSRETIERKENFDRTFLAGTMHAATVLACAAVKVDSSLKDKTFEVTVNGNKGTEFAARITPFKEGVIAGRDGQPDRPWTKKGGASGAIKTTTGTRGDLGVAIQHSENVFSELLKS